MTGLVAEITDYAWSNPTLVAGSVLFVAAVMVLAFSGMLGRIALHLEEISVRRPH